MGLIAALVSGSACSGGASDDGSEASGLAEPRPNDAETGGPIEAVCGDGVRQSGEACDDGNARWGDGCNPDCSVGGEQLWGVGIPESVSGRVLLALSSSGERVVVAEDGWEPPGVGTQWQRLRVHGFDGDGQLAWTRTLSEGEGTVARLMDLYADDGGVALVYYDYLESGTQLVHLDLEGETMWTLPLPGVTGSSPDRVSLAARGEELGVLTWEDGRPWIHRVDRSGGTRIDARPVSATGDWPVLGALHALDEGGYLYAVGDNGTGDSTLFRWDPSLAPKPWVEFVGPVTALIARHPQGWSTVSSWGGSNPHTIRHYDEDRQLLGEISPCLPCDEFGGQYALYDVVMTPELDFVAAHADTNMVSRIAYDGRLAWMRSIGTGNLWARRVAVASETGRVFVVGSAPSSALWVAELAP